MSAAKLQKASSIESSTEDMPESTFDRIDDTDPLELNTEDNLKADELVNREVHGTQGREASADDSVNSDVEIFPLALDTEQLNAKPKFTAAPKNLICPEPLPRLLADKDEHPLSGSQFNPVLHQSRRDMYGGDLKKGIPSGFQHILYDLSNAVIKTSNYGEINQETGKVFDGKQAIYEYLATFLEHRLLQRQDVNGTKTDYNPDDNTVSPPKVEMAEKVFKRTLDNSGFQDDYQ